MTRRALSIIPYCQEGMTRQECEEFVTMAITLAMSTDSSSGRV